VHALPRVVARHRLPRVESTERPGVVAERSRIGQWFEQIGRILESRARGIGDGEVEQRSALRPRRRQHRRQAVRRKLGRHAIREHRVRQQLGNDLDAVDDVALENLIDDVDAVQHLGKDRVVVIEARVVDEIDEDPRVAGVAAAR